MARRCDRCNKELTPAATFCTFCGAEAPLPTAPPPLASSARFCSACGAELVPGAKYCGSCGAPTSSAVAPAVPAAAPGVDAASPPGARSRHLLIAGIAAGVLLFGLLLWFNRYSWLGLEPPAGNQAAAIGAEQTMYVVASANLRDRATSQGSTVVGKLARGAKVTGTLELGEDGSSNWLRIAGTSHYVSVVNLSGAEPPAIARFINKAWYAPAETPILAKPQPGAPVLATAAMGAKYQIVGLTPGGFAEVLLEKGGVGYFDASGIDLEAGGAPPIELGFNPASCDFGREIEMLFRKLGQEQRRKFQLAEAARYPSEDARIEAMAALEGKSAYLPLNRSWQGLTVSGLGAHYESASVYFKDPVAKVRAVFARDFAVSGEGFVRPRDGPEPPVTASIAPTGSEEARYGQTSLSCGI